MPMTQFEISNAITHSDITAGIQRGRQMRAQAVRGLIDRMFHGTPIDHSGTYTGKSAQC